MNQNAEEKLARQRLSVLELAQTLGNVREACRRRGISRTKLYESVEMLQSDLDDWITHYNTERLHQGYRNLGRRPIEQYLDAVKNEA